MKGNNKLNNGENMNKPIRHGEILLVPINTKITGEKKTSYIVGHSESGHHHVLESKTPFVVSESDKQFVIELFEPAELVHKKTYDIHPTLPVAPGRYKVVRKTEYSPLERITRAVWD